MSPMLPKLKQNHMWNMCTAPQCSSSAPCVTAVIFTFAGDLVKSEGRIKNGGQTDLHHPTPPPRKQTDSSSKEPKPTQRFVVNLIEWFDIKHHQNAGKKKEQQKTTYLTCRFVCVCVGLSFIRLLTDFRLVSAVFSLNSQFCWAEPQKLILKRTIPTFRLIYYKPRSCKLQASSTHAAGF